MRRGQGDGDDTTSIQAEFKALVMEALRGTASEIGAKHHVHPNQVSGWKRQAQDGLRELADGVSRRQADHEATIHELQSAS